MGQDDGAVHEILAQYDSHRLERYPIGKVIGGAEARRCVMDLRAFEELAGVETVGHYLNVISRYDSYFLLYAYRYRGKVYAFAWETPYDELHRGYGGSEPTWYDDVVQGQKLRLRVCARSPRKHFVVDEVFRRVNPRVIYLHPRFMPA